MGFKNLLSYKRTLALFSAFVLPGINYLMAQTPGADGTYADHKGPDWAGVWYYIMLFFVVCLAVAITGKIIRVYDLTLKMQGKKGFNWNNVMGVICILFLVAGLAGAYWSLTEQGSMTLPEAASAHGVAIDEMFEITAFLTLIVFFVTQTLLFGFSFYYRSSDKRKAYYLPHNNTIEKVWTIVPAIVLTILVVFGFFTWQKITNSVDAKGEPASINIDVTGHQFAWYLRYPGSDGKLGSTNYTLANLDNYLGVDFKDRSSTDDLQADTLVIPVYKSIRLNIHAQDVIHSVYMPHFRLQLNAVPGLPTYFKFTPTITTAAMRIKTENPKFEYLLYCNKICGSGHYNMKKIVRVVSQAEYQDWIARQKPYLTAKLKEGLRVAAAKAAGSSINKTNSLAINN